MTVFETFANMASTVANAPADGVALTFLAVVFFLWLAR